MIYARVFQMENKQLQKNVIKKTLSECDGELWWLITFIRY